MKITFNTPGICCPQCGGSLIDHSTEIVSQKVEGDKLVADLRIVCPHPIKIEESVVIGLKP